MAIFWPACLVRSFCLGAAARNVANKCSRAPEVGRPNRGDKGLPRWRDICACPLLPLIDCGLVLEAPKSSWSNSFGGRLAKAAANIVSSKDSGSVVGGAGVSSCAASCSVLDASGGGGGSGGGADSASWLEGIRVARGDSTICAAMRKSSSSKNSRSWMAACTDARRNANKGARMLSMPSANATSHNARICASVA